MTAPMPTSEGGVPSKVGPWIVASKPIVMIDHKSAAATDLPAPMISRVVTSLEADGLVVRSSEPSNTRAVNVTITERGLDVFQAAQDEHLRDLDRYLFSLLTDKEVRQLASITTKILAAQQLPIK